MRVVVLKNRRLKEKRAIRKMGYFKLFKKEYFKEKIEICLICGNYYRRGFFCGKKKIGSNESLLKMK